MWRSSDTLIVLGKGFVKDKTKPLKGGGFAPQLSEESRITARAAAVLYKEHVVKHLVFCGGHTAGKDHLSEAEAMQELAVLYGDIPYDQCLLEDASIDTHQNAENLRKMDCGKEKFKHDGPLALLTLSFHLPRALEVFSRHGFVKMRPYASDAVLLKTPVLSSEYDLVTRYHASTQFKIEKAKELIGKVIQRFDPDGVNLRKITRIIRHEG